MKKSLLLIGLLFFLCSCSNDVKKAKEFMASGMYPQAIELLDKTIHEKPADAEAHCQLGVCYINIGNFRNADKRFDSAVRLNSGYGYKIGGEYKRVGDDSLNSGGYGQARGLYQQAVKYQPNLRKEIVKEIYSQGKSLFDKGQYSLADSIFLVTTAFDSSLKQQISDMYFNLGQTANDINCVGLYRLAEKYSSSHNKEIGERIVQLSKAPNISGTEKKKYKKEASRYLRKAEMRKAFPPDYIVYKRGKHKINLKAGQTTKRWFTFPIGVLFHLDSKDRKYKIIYPDGDIKSAWLLKTLPNKYKFKLKAVTDQKITLTVK